MVRSLVFGTRSRSELFVDLRVRLDVWGVMSSCRCTLAMPMGRDMEEGGCSVGMGGPSCDCGGCGCGCGCVCGCVCGCSGVRPLSGSSFRSLCVSLSLSLSVCLSRSLC